MRAHYRSETSSRQTHNNNKQATEHDQCISGQSILTNQIAPSADQATAKTTKTAKTTNTKTTTTTVPTLVHRCNVCSQAS